MWNYTIILPDNSAFLKLSGQLIVIINGYTYKQVSMMKNTKIEEYLFLLINGI